MTVWVSQTGHERITAMAGVLTSDEEDINASDVYRRLLAEAVAVRLRDCARRHRGPVRGGTCGHCGERGDA